MLSAQKSLLSKGFTLIELLIVVAIIAILAAIAVPNFLEAQTRSKISRVKSDMRTIATGLEIYRLDANDYPTGFGLTVSPNDRWRFGLWLLSTPVAYISSGDIQDPMHKKQVNHPTESTIQYNAMHNDGYGRRGIVLSEFLRFNSSRNPSGTSVVPFGSDGFKFSSGVKTHWWMLFSNGPDQVSGFGATEPEYDLELRILNSESQPAAFLDVVYDATNGTVSTGNVWRGGGADTNFAGRTVSSGG